MVRKEFYTYFMEIAELVSTRSTCTRRQVGAVAVRDSNILSTGYNGAPSKTKHCAIVGCVREELNVPSGERHELCRAVHAEQNVIIQAAKNGVSLKDTVLYTTTFPCVICTKMIINVGIKKIFYFGAYNDELSIQLLDEAGVLHLSLFKALKE
jgi:dCMP deaminase